MTDKPNAAAPDTADAPNMLADDAVAAAEKFQGFATHDGERIEPKATDDKPLKGGEKKVVPTAKKAQADEPEGDADDEPEGDAENGEYEDDKKEQRHKSAQARIDKAVRRQRAAEREARQWRDRYTSLEARLAALERGGSAPKGGGEAPKPKHDPNEPQPADYKFGELDADYIRDLATYRAEKAIEARLQQREQSEKNAKLTAAQQAFLEARNAFMEKGLDIADDFEEVVMDQSLHISQTLAEVAFNSEYGPTIIYAMASDPKEAKRVSAMTPSRQAAWFGQKEAELSSESSDAEDDTGQERPHSDTSPKTTKAPPPPKGKARGSGTAQQISPATTDFKQFERLAMSRQE